MTQSAENQSPKTKFPANREINREFRRIRPSTAIFVSDERANSMASSRIHYATEQGIFNVYQGIFFEEQGILIEGAAKPGEPQTPGVAASKLVHSLAT